MTVQERIKQLVDNSGKTYAKLERMTGIPKSSLQRYATGCTPKVPLDAIRKLSEVFRVSQVWLMGYDMNNDTEINQTEVREIVGELQVFNYNENPVRTVVQDGEPWFVLKDVCEVLNLSTPKRVAERLDNDEVSLTHLIDAIGRKQETTIINESGLYNVILRSDKPQAKPFRKWVTAEVLPCIRKTGGYIQGQETLSPAELMAKALMVAQKTLEEREARISELTVENQRLLPRAEYFDALVDRNLLTNFRDTAKQLGIKEREFVKFLIEKKYIYRDKGGKLHPYAQKSEGLFEIKECFNEKTNWSGTQTLITPKGRETFRLLLTGC